MKVAFVGLGYAAESLHLPAVRALRELELVGVTDTSGERRSRWEKLGAGPVFTTAAELLGATSPDLVVVSSPPGTHEALCVQALEAGAHVLCEKPLAESTVQGERVRALAAERGLTVAVNQEFRYMPIFSAIPPLLGTADIGRPIFLQFLQLMDLAPWDESVPWRAAMTERVLLEGGVHLVDLTLMMLGKLPRSLVAVTSAGLDPSHRADAIHLVTMDFGDGVVAQIAINRLTKAGTRYVDLRLDCEDASIRSSMGGRAYVRLGLKRAERPGVRIDVGLGGLAWLERGHRRKVIARNPFGAARRATRSLYVDVVDAISRGAEPATSARSAIDALKVIDAAYLSARTGERVSVVPGASFSAST